MKEDNISQSGDYDAPFCEQQYTHGSSCIALFKFKSFDQFNPIRPGLFSRSPGPGRGSEAQMPKIKVNINQLK